MMSSLARIPGAEQSAESSDLQLQFCRAPDKRTFISHQYGRYPYHVCRAQYVDTESEGLATVYLQSSSGGVFEHDDLSCEIHGLPHSQSHITTQASTIAHRMDNGCASHCVILRAEEDSFIEYLPDPMILFPHSELRSTVDIKLHPSATVILADGFTHHDPDQNQDIFRSYFSEVRVENLEGKLLCLDRYNVFGQKFLDGELGIMGGNKIQSTFLVFTNAISLEELSNMLRESIDDKFDGYGGVSLLPNKCGVMVRLVSPETYQVKLCLTSLWNITRNQITGAYPSPRRK